MSESEVTKLTKIMRENCMSYRELLDLSLEQ